jgi:DNA-binding response OmpR family regulator
MTSRSREEDVVAALSAGADDYMTKPIRNAELIARVEALVRRTNQHAPRSFETIEVGRYRINPATRTCCLGGSLIELTCREFDLALLMFQYVGRILSREQIGAAVWGQPESAISRTLDTHVSKVRAKLQLRPENGLRLASVYGHGYRLDVAGDPQEI